MNKALTEIIAHLDEQIKITNKEILLTLPQFRHRGLGKLSAFQQTREMALRLNEKEPQTVQDWAKEGSY